MIDLQLAPDKEITEDANQLSDHIREIYDRTIKAFFASDIKLANAVAGMIEEVEMEVETLTEKIFSKLQAGSSPAKASLNAYLAMRAIITDLGQISQACLTIAEVTINRHLETQSEFHHLEKT